MQGVQDELDRLVEAGVPGAFAYIQDARPFTCGQSQRVLLIAGTHAVQQVRASRAAAWQATASWRTAPMRGSPRAKAIAPARASRGPM